MVVMIRLFELRNEKGLSQRQLAKIFKISQSTYNNWENAKTQPTIESLIAIADYFGVTLDYLVGREREDGVVEVVSDDKEKTVIERYKRLSPEQQTAMTEFIKTLC